MLKRIAAVLLLVYATGFSQSNSPPNQIELFSLDDVKHGMPMKGVADALRRRAFKVSEEPPGLLFVYKDGREIGWMVDDTVPENAEGTVRMRHTGKVAVIHYTYEPIDFAVALFNSAQLHAKGTAPNPYRRETFGDMTVGTVAFTGEKEDTQYLTLAQPGVDGLYRMIIHRPTHAAPTIEFEMVR